MYADMHQNKSCLRAVLSNLLTPLATEEIVLKAIGHTS